jgi:hypothetical protein
MDDRDRLGTAFYQPNNTKFASHWVKREPVTARPRKDKTAQITKRHDSPVTPPTRLTPLPSDVTNGNRGVSFF